MKKSLSFLLAFVLILSLFAFPVSAASATFSLSGSGSVIVGNKVNVTVKFSGSEKIGSWRFSLTYDPSVLEYVSGADSGGGGAVLFSDSSDGISSYSRTVVFRAKKIGSATVAVSGAQVVSFDSASNMSISGASKKISVTAAPILSGENNLSALALSTGELSPAFDPKTTSYALSVPFEVSSLAISATAKDTKASVAVTGADALVVGENKVEVVVTAQNGTRKSYVITVTRQESELAGVTTQVGEESLSVAYDPAMLQIPEGYQPTTALLGDKKILSYAAPQNTILISYLYKEVQVEGVEGLQKVGAWYVFDEKTQSFTPYVTVSGQPGLVVVLNPGKDVKVPEGFVPETIQVGEQSISAYAVENSKDTNIYLVYGMTSDGTAGFYYYDARLSSFTAYFVPDTGISKEAQKEIDTLKKDLADSDKKAEQILIIALAVGIVAVLLLIGLIISLATRKRKATPDFTETIVAEPLPEFIPPAQVKKRKARRTIEKQVPLEEEIPAEEENSLEEQESEDPFESPVEEEEPLEESDSENE